jgi:multicomponent Na+:H+ antiporter subunit E
VRLAWAILRRGALGAGLWLLLTGGDTGTPVLAVLVIAAAVAASLAVLPPTGRIRPVGVARFAVFFARESLRGGLDVARRAYTPGRVPLAPGFVEREMRLPAEPARLLAAGCTSLLPGTLSVELDGRTLLVHVLDTGMPFEQTLDALEDHVAGMFGLELDPR